MEAKDLTKYDFYVVIDRSGSMSKEDVNGKSRWAAAEELTENLARKCSKYDTNGISVVVFNDNFKAFENITGGDGKVEQIFKELEPSGSTALDRPLKYILDKYIASKGQSDCKPIIVLVVTDGEPNDQKAVADVIIDATTKIQDENEIGIEFIQIGQDQSARDYLKMLDEHLTGAKFDIVNAKTMDELAGVNLEDAIMDAVNS